MTWLVKSVLSRLRVHTYTWQRLAISEEPCYRGPTSMARSGKSSPVAGNISRRRCSLHPPFVFRRVRSTLPAFLPPRSPVKYLVSSLSKCLLTKAIFEYMVESARAKKYRIDVQSRLHAAPPPTLRPAMRLLSSLRSVREANTNKIFVHEQDEQKPTIDSGTAISMIPLTPASKMSPR